MKKTLDFKTIGREMKDSKEKLIKKIFYNTA